MNIAFNFPIPDEPYKTTFIKKDFVKCIYTGSRYLLLCVEAETGYIKNVVGSSNEKETLPKMIENDNTQRHIIFDATTNLIAAAFFTHSYTNEEVPDYEEVIPIESFDGSLSKYTFKFATGNTGVIEQLLYFNAIKYDFKTEKFTEPEYRIHANTRESTLEGFRVYADQIDNKLKTASENFSKTDYQTLEKFSKWLRNIETNFKDVDHWKIPFPANIPSLP